MNHETIFVNVTQMTSSLTNTPRLKWLGNPSALHQPQKLFSQYPLFPWQTNYCSGNTQGRYSPKPYSSNLHQVDDSCTCRCITTNQQNWCCTSAMFVSVRHHNTLSNRSKYNCDNVTGWASAPVHNIKDLKTLKDNALKAYLPNELHTLTTCSLSLT